MNACRKLDFCWLPIWKLNMYITLLIVFKIHEFSLIHTFKLIVYCIKSLLKIKFNHGTKNMDAHKTFYEIHTSNQGLYNTFMFTSVHSIAKHYRNVWNGTNTKPHYQNIIHVYTRIHHISTFTFHSLCSSNKLRNWLYFIILHTYYVYWAIYYLPFTVCFLHSHIVHTILVLKVKKPFVCILLCEDKLPCYFLIASSYHQNDNQKNEETFTLHFSFYVYVFSFFLTGRESLRCFIGFRLRLNEIFPWPSQFLSVYILVCQHIFLCGVNRDKKYYCAREKTQLLWCVSLLYW